MTMLVCSSSSGLIAYCERGAFTKDVKALWKTRHLSLIHFPYDHGDRIWHDKHHIPFAKPSLVTLDTTQLRFSDEFQIHEMYASEKYAEIARILCHEARNFDVRHFDSAYKSGAKIFITTDRNYSVHAENLQVLTGIIVINPTISADLTKLKILARPGRHGST